MNRYMSGLKRNRKEIEACGFEVQILASKTLNSINAERDDSEFDTYKLEFKTNVFAQKFTDVYTSFGKSNDHFKSHTVLKRNISTGESSSESKNRLTLKLSKSLSEKNVSDFVQNYKSQVPLRLKKVCIDTDDTDKENSLYESPYSKSLLFGRARARTTTDVSSIQTRIKFK